MLGGGVFVTQDKTLPGSYLNFINASAATSTIGERGVVAIPLNLNKHEGNVIEITRDEFYHNCQEKLGFPSDAHEMQPLREIFCHANKVYVFDAGDAENENYLCSDWMPVLAAYDFNVLAYFNESKDETKLVCDEVIAWRDELGKKVQVVVPNYKANHEGVISVYADWNGMGDHYELVPWVAGALAGCKINESCTNMLYDGEVPMDNLPETQAELEEHIKNGEFVFHQVYGEVRVLEDINSLTTVTKEKGEDFKSNQTIRVIDQIANDIARMYNNKYLGKVQNDKSGRVSLWGDIVKHHRELEAIGAIEPFDTSLLTVEQGANKKSVVVNDAISVVGAMAQLYMTVVIK